MNCCKNNENKETNQGCNKKHMVLMMLCCAIPVALLLLMPIFKINNPVIKGLLSSSMFSFVR